LSSLGPTYCPRVIVCHLVFVRHWSHLWSLHHTRMVVGSSFRWLVVAGFRAEWRSLCRGSLCWWSVGWHERGMATNHDKCRGSCFYDAPNGPPTPGSPLPLFPNPYSSVGKVRACPHLSGEGRGIGLWLVEGVDGVARVMVVVKK